MNFDYDQYSPNWKEYCWYNIQLNKYGETCTHTCRYSVKDEEYQWDELLHLIDEFGEDSPQVKGYEFQDNRGLITQGPYDNPYRSPYVDGVPEEYLLLEEIIAP